ncbi:MAG TPA: IS110 family transposase [Candidatus Angelobacter sp.]|nr:IS110 family transposase [Candidatus Angelobacter sp.]
MEVIHPRCCGIDVHQASLAVCVSIKEGGQSEKYRLRCGTTTAELVRLVDWLHGYQVTHVAMEATGVYWKPVWHILEGQFELLLANPTQVQALRGRKTDLKDGERIADFMQHGLLEGSFVPPRPIQQLRDLTRSRTTLKQEQVRIGNRIRKVLEDANIKLSSVMSDVMGVSGRAMLRAMVKGETDPAALAQLARKRLRGKIPVLQEAATGTLNEHHRFLLDQWLAHWDELTNRIAQFDERIQEQVRPFAAAVETWSSLPGIDRITAWTIIAEMGADMAQFPSTAHAASWAGLCPGQDESAGKRKSGRTRQGNIWLRRALTQSAWGASMTKRSYFKAFYHRLAARKGKKRAIVAVAHSLLSTGYILLWTGKKFSDLGEDYFEHLDRERLTNRLVKRLEKLGHQVSLQPAA